MPSADFTGPERLERLTRNLVRALQGRSDPAGAGQFRDQSQAAGRTGRRGRPAGLGLPGPGLGSLSRGAGYGSRRLAVARADHLPPAARRTGGWRAAIESCSARCRRRRRRSICESIRLEPHGLRRRRGREGARASPAECQPLSSAADGPSGRLAADAKLRPQLLQALDTLEQTKDFAQLPALFATTPGDTKELAYLDDALATSLDQLIGDASPDARRLLWMIAVANDPVALELLQGRVERGRATSRKQLRQIKQMLDMLPQLPEDLQAKLKACRRSFVRDARRAAARGPPRPDLAPLLRHLVSVGLATEERTGPEDENPELTCHELVRERIRAVDGAASAGPRRTDGERHPAGLRGAAGGGVQARSSTRT